MCVTATSSRSLERGTELRRPGSTPGDVQLLAANIDLVLVVLPIDRELNSLMLERLVVMAFDSGARPYVVLTKSDGSEVVEDRRARGQGDGPRASRSSRRARPAATASKNCASPPPGVTAVMLGASGAGKTSLLNALEGIERGDAAR